MNFVAINYKGYTIEFMDFRHGYRIYPSEYSSWYGMYAKTVEEAKKVIDIKKGTNGNKQLADMQMC